MQLARVVGSVVATRKEESIQGLKLLLVRPLDDEGREFRPYTHYNVGDEGRESGNAIVSADAVGAGPDEIVLIAAGSSARQTAATDKRPVDSVIMAIVDSWYVGDDVKYKK